MLRPRPVPWPSGLVVKNGSNTRCRISGGMPAPVSVTENTTYSPGESSGLPRQNAASSTRLAARTVSVPSACIASRALIARLSSAFSS